ncbi:MAG TPA: TonB-dependent receptor [Gammaproteobacteria bacterium]
MALAIPMAHRAYAQQGGASEPEEILVTGSRIVRRDYVANSPIQTVDALQFEQQSSIAMEETLNRLPQFVPAATGYTQVQDGELINTGSTTTAGAATLSLRGLGPNRNLVLINGYRAMPVNATMAVDMNTIPAAAIERVEVITGGASSVYGADAVAGVVNFILKDDFEGIELDVQYGAMDNGHAGNSRATALFGSSTADGRGNVMVGIEYANRDAVLWKDVEFYRKALEDPTVGGTVRILGEPYYNIDAANPPSGAVIDSIFDQAPAGVVLRNSANAVTGRVYLNDDGSVYAGGASFDNTSPPGPGATAGLYRYNGPLRVGDFQFRKIDSQGRLQQNNPDLKANVPLERYSLFARATYDVSDRITASIQATNVESEVVQAWNISPATGGWSQVIPHGDDVYAPSLAADGTTLPEYREGGAFGLACPPTGGCTESQAFPVSPELAALLDSRTDPDADWSLNYTLDFPHFGRGVPRQVVSENRTNQFSFGLQGEIDGIDGGWDLVASHGTSQLSILLQGFASVERLRTIMQSPNYGRGFFRQGNAGPPGNGFAGGVATCTSGIPVFRPHWDITQDCLDAIIVELQHQSEMEQNFVEANVQGKLVDMPAGEARFSVGTHWRENTYRYIFDTLNTQASFLDQGLGTFPANSTRGSTSVSELYGEMLLPLARDLPGARHLNLEVGYRYSDYEYQGGIDTYKALIDWGITDELRFRGGRQLATRAPNIAEMFQAQSQTWSAASPGDPCGLNSIAPYGVNPAVNPNAAQARALCEALMGAGAADFYDPSNPQPNGNSSNWFVNAVGNPDVDPEEATTWTAGFVYQPAGRGRLLDGFSATVDWYRIEIDDMIAVEPGSAVYEACLSTVSNPTGDVDHPACRRIIRNPETGGATASNVSYINAGEALVSGVDVSTNWGVDLGRGTFGINMIWSKLIHLKTQATPTSPLIDWKGTLGPTPGTSLNNGAYDYRLFTTLSYGLDDWSFSLRWRHLPSAEAAQEATTTGPVVNLGAQEDYDVLDFSASWNVRDTVTLRFGIDNVLDEEPVITGGRNELDPNPTSGQGTTEAGFYDILGRQLFVGVKASF